MNPSTAETLQEANTSGKRARFESLQTFRALAAFAVVLHHVNGKFSAPHYYGDIVPEVFYGGQAGVDFFFVLSGFIITQSLVQSKSAGEFLLHRALRVFPPFWLAFLFTLPVAIALAGRLHSPVSTDWLSLAKAVLLGSIPFRVERDSLTGRPPQR